MIKAAYINNLFEEWKSVRGKKIEVLDNPSSWREAFSAFKPDLRELKKKGISQLLRFVYHPKTEEIKIWIGFFAIHEDILICGRVRDAKPRLPAQKRCFA